MIVHGFDTVCPSVLALPSFLESTGHKNITDGLKTPFHQAFNTSLPAFEYLAQPGNERQYKAFQATMTAQQNSHWMIGLSVLNDAAMAAQNDDDAEKAPAMAFFVDVGGGNGHQCVQLLSKYPWLAGRVVLEDLPAAVGKLDPIEGVQIREQDFFQDQVVKGLCGHSFGNIL